MGAMLARRLLLLGTFAGGCLSGAVLIAFWSGEPETISSPTKQRVARTSKPISPPIATTTAAPARANPDDAPDADDRTEPGSSVADLLASLEAAYRKGLAAAAPAHAPSSADPSTDAPAEAEPSDVPAREEPTVAVAVNVAVAAPAPAPANAPEVVANPATAPQADPRLVVASRDDPPPRNVNVHIGDVNQNTHVGDVVQGDVVVVQQPVVSGYLPFFTQPSYPRVAPPMSALYPSFTTRGVTSRSAPTFASSWTVPQDRLGYDSALIPMLK